uniref:RING-type E3 ubiquitin transferase n=2 Tax=Lutzomyia longipalpis TaxID=7200 RepID=A0A1B0CB36_LUTLO
MDEDDNNQPAALSPRVLLYDIVQQSSNAPDQQVQDTPGRSEARGNRRRYSESREVSPHSEDDIMVENLKKRKKRGSVKISSPTQSQKTVTPKKDDQDDDGVMCPICYEEWDMSGVHRLTSLKCGHLFGHSCIKRWLNECPPNARVCPSCKTKATMRDMRFLYAKRLRMVDNSEVERLKTALEETITKKSHLETEMALLRMRYEHQLTENSKLTREIRRLREQTEMSLFDNTDYYMEKNVEIGREAGCRVIQFGKNSKTLVVSQKSNQNLFPGYGVRFVDVETLRPTTFMHMSSRSIRDMAFDNEAELLVGASLEHIVKVFDVSTKSCNVVLKCPEEDHPMSKMIWTSCFDRTRDHAVIVGCQNGRVARFDMRCPTTPQDFRPVIDMASIPPDNTLPYGGIVVCTLQNLWLYDFAPHGLPRDITALPVEGPFTAMVYSEINKYILITLRPSQAANRHTSQLIVGRLDREGECIIFKITNRFIGSTSMPSMYRSTFINVEQDTLVAGYVHSSKVLTTWSIRDDSRQQIISATEPILDFSSFKVNSQTYLGAITDTKCRIYK